MDDRFLVQIPPHLLTFNSSPQYYYFLPKGGYALTNDIEKAAMDSITAIKFILFEPDKRCLVSYDEVLIHQIMEM